MSKNVPSFFEKEPEPKPVQRKYHGEVMQMWRGQIAISSIQGWVDNPRIEMEIQRQQSDIGAGQEITQEMVYEIMKNDRAVKLKDLRDDILKNGLREPLVLSFNGELIDGNRRFFAIKYALENLTGAARAPFERVVAFALTKDASRDQVQKILVEENFAPSLKEEWPYYVKARHIARARDDGLKPKEIADKFGWGIGKVRETMRILDIIDQFGSFARGNQNPEDPGGGGLGLNEQEVEDFVADKNHYQFFNEAQKKLHNELLSGSDPDFPSKFYKWLYEGKYASFPEIRVAYEAWQDPEARHKMETGGADAGKKAKAVIDYKKMVVKDDTDAAHRISNFMDFLGKLTVEQMSRMPEQVLDNLRKSLETVIEMMQSGKK